MVNRLSNVAIAPSLAIRNFEQRIPANQLKIGAAEIEREGKLAALAREILVELAKVRCQGGAGFLQLKFIGVQLLHPRFKFEPH